MMAQNESVVSEDFRDQRRVENYAYYREGDKDPSSGKVITKLIMSNPDYIVYLDPENRIEWSVTEEYEDNNKGYSELFSEVISKVIELEGISKSVSMPDSQIIEYRTLLGASIVTMLEKDTAAIIREVVKKADTYLKERMAEMARKWYLISSFIYTGIYILAILIALNAGNYNDLWSHIFHGTAMGALGALISIITRSEKIYVNISAGKYLHFLETAARIVVGILGGVLAALAVKADILLGIFKSSKEPLALLLIVCFVAGASERFVPSIIKHVEGMIEKGKKESEP
jgi:hypothetical protein